MSPIQRGLKDRHPYVRRTAVMGVLKVYNFDADAVRNAGACPAASPARQSMRGTPQNISPVPTPF
jgi:vesicle coat complex subunit